MSVPNLIELNMGISKKPVVPFVWLKKSGPTPFCKDGKVNFEMERISSPGGGGLGSCFFK
ncbi:MAG: hypothetical protein IPO33_07150 [Saprospiraceae bacterium]|nr:hypothetical protein [Candidatus Brachybacter algidus]